MNWFTFFVLQIVISLIAIAYNGLFSEFINGQSFFHNRFIIALIKASIDLVIMYFTFKIYFLLKTKLRYKILLHIGAFIVGAVVIVLTGNLLGLK